MGLFKDFKDSMDAAGAAMDGAAAMQQDAAAAAAAAAGPVDPDDPIWEPIAGVTLDQYARITAAMARQSLGTPDQAQAWLAAQGVEPGTWGEVQSGWVDRMATSEAVRTRYGVLYSQS